MSLHSAGYGRGEAGIVRNLTIELNKSGAQFYWHFSSALQVTRGGYPCKALNSIYKSRCPSRLTLTRPDSSTAADIPKGILV